MRILVRAKAVAAVLLGMAVDCAAFHQPSVGFVAPCSNDAFIARRISSVFTQKSRSFAPLRLYVGTRGYTPLMMSENKVVDISSSALNSVV